MTPTDVQNELKTLIEVRDEIRTTLTAMRKRLLALSAELDDRLTRMRKTMSP